MERMHESEIQLYAEKAGFTVKDDEVQGYGKLVDAAFDALERFDSVVEEEDSDVGNRDPGRPPADGEDPLNAVVRWCDVSSDGTGMLSGKRVGVKDVICVAGIPMTAGSRLLQGFVPRYDSDVSKRVLATGGEIVAMLNMEDFAFSGGGETSFYGPILNPHDPKRTAGGSSGGCGAALFYDEIDIAYGADQGGSGRLPASWCGTLGLKPTSNLVPYSGVGELDKTFDNIGVLARSVEDLALGLQAVAGRTWADPRQMQDLQVQDYLAAVADAEDDLSGLRVGVVKEGFIDDASGHPDGTAETMETVREALPGFTELGASVSEVSVPEHEVGGMMFSAALLEGATATIAQCGDGYHWKGRYSPDLSVALGVGFRDHVDELSPSVKWVQLVGTFLKERYFGSIYGRAQNAAWRIREGFDRVFSEYDILVMPTATHYAHELAPDAAFEERVMRGYGMIGNGPSANVSGCPALSLPAAEYDGLPVGIQILGRQGDDARLISVAATWEKTHGWIPRAPVLDRKPSDQGTHRSKASG